MPIDPSIAGGYKGIQIADPMAQYAQMVAIQNAQNQNIAAQNQNALAQYQLGSAQRSDASANALSEGYRQAVNPDTGELDVNRLVRHLAGSGAASQIPGVLEMQAKREKAGLERQKLEGEVGTVATVQFRNALADVNTPEQAAAWVKAQYAHPVLGGIVSRLAPLEKAMANIPSDPAGFAEWKSKHSMGMENYLKDQTTKLIATNRLDFDKAKLKWEQDNPTLTVQETPQGLLSVNSKTGASTPLMFNGKQVMGTGGANLDLAQKRLKFEQDRFAWEKANPGYTLHADDSGAVVGVNTKTLQAFPVTMGAGAGAPAAPGAAMVAPAVAGAAAPVAHAVAGAPLMGPRKDLTESQGAATAYGIRMNESHDILKKLENQGVANTGRISGAVGGLLGITPLIGDKLENATGSVFNALPGILAGLSPDQQRVQQARINFITAVLRKESGASISPSEFITAEKLYFPKPGDDKTNIEQKQRTRETAIRTMEVQAGSGAKNIRNPASDPLGLR